jgi:hypothetical protein
MSSDRRYLMEKVSFGRGRVLDLGGGDGDLRRSIVKKGYA